MAVMDNTVNPMERPVRTGVSGPRRSLGVVGTGVMGSPLALRALDCGLAVSVRDIVPQATAAVAAAGARVCDSPAELGRQCDLVVILVVDAIQVEEVIFGTDGLVRGLARGGTVAVSSTISPAYAEALAPRLEAVGLQHLDAPVSGGPSRARDGTLSMMAAGSDATFEAARPRLECLAGRLFRAGARAGDGARAKILNNLLAGVHLAAASEALALGERMGLDPNALMAIMRASSGDSWMLADRMPRILGGDHTVRAALDILRKDLGIVVDAALPGGRPVPLAQAARGVFDAASAAGFGAADDAALLDWYRGAAPPA